MIVVIEMLLSGRGRAAVTRTHRDSVITKNTQIPRPALGHIESEKIELATACPPVGVTAVSSRSIILCASMCRESLASSEIPCDKLATVQFDSATINAQTNDSDESTFRLSVKTFVNASSPR